MVHGGWFDEPTPVRHLEIEADGPWSITARPMSAARKFSTSLEGTRDDVVLYTGSSHTMTVTHVGDQYDRFWIRGYLRSGEYNDEILFEDRNYSGTRVVDADTEILEIEAVGEWTLATP